MSNPFLAEIRMFAGNFAPRGWALCNGQLMSISQNTALFSILGTTYGGNGTTTFALPDLRGRAPIGPRQGPGLSSYSLGEEGGTEQVTLLSTQMPAHNHLVNVSSTQSSNVASGNFLASDGAYATAPSAATTLHAGALSTSGGGQPHSNLQPFLALNYI